MAQSQRELSFIILTNESCLINLITQEKFLDKRRSLIDKKILIEMNSSNFLKFCGMLEANLVGKNLETCFDHGHDNLFPFT